MAHSGEVVSWKLDRGFGFVSPEDGGEDIFVHVKNIGKREYLKIGEKVTTIDLFAALKLDI